MALPTSQISEGQNSGVLDFFAAKSTKSSSKKTSLFAALLAHLGQTQEGSASSSVFDGRKTGSDLTKKSGFGDSTASSSLAEKLFRMSWSDIQGRSVASASILTDQDDEVAQAVAGKLFSKYSPARTGFYSHRTKTLDSKAEKEAASPASETSGKKEPGKKSDSPSLHFTLSAEQEGSQSAAAAGAVRTSDVLDKGVTSEKRFRSQDTAGAGGSPAADLNPEAERISRLVASRLKSYVETGKEESTGRENFGSQIASRIKELAGRSKSETNSPGLKKTAEKSAATAALDKASASDKTASSSVKEQFNVNSVREDKVPENGKAAKAEAANVASGAKAKNTSPVAASKESAQAKISETINSTTARTAEPTVTSVAAESLTKTADIEPKDPKTKVDSKEKGGLGKAKRTTGAAKSSSKSVGETTQDGVKKSAAQPGAPNEIRREKEGEEPFDKTAAEAKKDTAEAKSKTIDAGKTQAASSAYDRSASGMDSLASQRFIKMAPAGFSQMFAKYVEMQLSQSGAQSIHRATISLEPPNLGKLDVELKVSGSHVKATFVASTQAVKTLLDSNMADLQQSFSNAGFEQGEASVFLRDDQSKGSDREGKQEDKPASTGRVKQIEQTAPLQAVPDMAGEGRINVKA